MNNIRLILSDGTIIPMLAAGTKQEITAYFLGAVYTDKKIISVEFIIKSFYF